MLTTKTIKEMCAAPRADMPYYRPLVCKGELSEIDVFLAGINPATPITSSNLSFEDYVRYLLDYERFLKYYSETRVRNGKPPKSRTRTGIDSFVKWLSHRTSKAIAETNVIAYPTENTKALKRLPEGIKDRGRSIFYKLAVGIEPSLIILHGKKAVTECVPLFERKGLLRRHIVNLDDDIEVMETRSPLFSFRFRVGKQCNVVACRHFMYYGKSGQSFAGFRSVVEQFLPD